eukprot:12329245-Karenia_brevis.AAC.1
MADASAALGIISRKGLGKVRHIDTSFLWIQEVGAKRALEFKKVSGQANMADLMTKHLAREDIERHFIALGLEKNKPRPEAASRVAETFESSGPEASFAEWAGGQARQARLSP